MNRFACALPLQNHRIPTLMSVYVSHDLKDSRGSYSRSGPVVSYTADKLAEDAWKALCRSSKGRDSPIDWCVYTCHVQYYVCTVSVMCVYSVCHVCVQCLSCVQCLLCVYTVCRVYSVCDVCVQCLSCMYSVCHVCTVSVMCVYSVCRVCTVSVMCVQCLSCVYSVCHVCTVSVMCVYSLCDMYMYILCLYSSMLYIQYV